MLGLQSLIWKLNVLKLSYNKYFFCHKPFSILPVEDHQLWSEVPADMENPEQTKEEEDSIDGKYNSCYLKGLRELFEDGAGDGEEEQGGVEEVVEAAALVLQLAIQVAGGLDEDFAELVQDEDEEPDVEKDLRVLETPGEVENCHIGIKQQEQEVADTVSNKLDNRCLHQWFYDYVYTTNILMLKAWELSLQLLIYKLDGVDI